MKIPVLPLLISLRLSVAALASEPQQVLWSIGKPDSRDIEFAPGARDKILFEVGKNVVSRDFPGHHCGSVDFEGKTKEQPYTIMFDLPEAPTGPYHLVLDLIYKSGAPRQIEVMVNDSLGIFPVRFEPKKSADGEEANMMLLAQQHLVVPIDGAWLKKQRNRITLVPLGIGGLDYDALALVRGAGDPELLHLDPTIFFRKSKGGLVEICELVVPFQRHVDKGSVVVQLGKDKFTKTWNSGKYDFGILTQPMEIRADVEASRASVAVNIDGVNLQITHPFATAKQWKIFICPKVHNDVGYTDLQPHVNELDNRNTDTALDIMDQFPFYKFNFETAWLVDNYLNCRPLALRKRFFRQLQDGRATMNAFYLNLMTGLCTGEELYRAMYFTHRLQREHGGNFDFACLTDAPSHTWFLPSLLSDVGIKCFANGANQTRAPILHFSDLNEHSPYWWEGPNGERIFMWYARSYTQWKRLTGPDFVSTAASSDYLRTSVPQFLTQFLRSDYSPDAVMIYGAYVDNAAIPRTGEAELIEQWNKEFEFPKMIVASDAEYFSYIKKNFGSQLPVYRGDCGAYWEDGVASSAAQTALNRQTQQLLPAAEMAHSFAALFQPRERYPAEDFTRAWENVMFYNEHTWGAHNSVSQPDREFVARQWEVKESYATRANLDARNLLARGFNRLTQNIAVEGDTALVFNWQNWTRTAPLEVELNSGQHLIDLTTDKPVALDKVAERDGWKRVRFLAENVPPFGYRGYAIRSFDAPNLKRNEPANGDTIESRFYRVTVDLHTGGIKSLFDKTEKRELADASAPYKLNQYVYVTGGENSLILNHHFGTPPAKLTVRPPVAARIVENVKTPIGQRIIVVTSCSNAPSIRSEYLVYDGVPRVDIANTIEKIETRAKEAVYFAFPFAARQPAFEYQIQNAWCRPNEDQMPGACREWFTPQNLVHLRDGDFDVAWATPDAPLVCLTDINRGQWLAHLPIKNGHIYSYVMHNYWFTNYRARQGGTLRFRYSIASGRQLNREALARFDADTRTPLLAYPFVSSFSARVGGGDDRPLSPASGSLLSLDAANLQVVTLKEAEDGEGWILRLREMAGRAGEADVKFISLRLKEAQLCNGVEVNQQKLPSTPDALRVPYKPNQFITLRLKAQPAVQRLVQR